MPLTSRVVEPIQLFRQPVSDEYKFDLDVFANNRLVGCVRQLSCLALQADDLFADLVKECENVCERTDKLNDRLQNLTNSVGKLDAKTCPLSTTELSSLKLLAAHRTDIHNEANLFTPASRPKCLSQVHSRTAPSPLPAIRSCDVIRTDGVRGTFVFSPQLVLNDTALESQKPLERPRRKYKKLIECLPSVLEGRPMCEDSLEEPSCQQRARSLDDLDASQDASMTDQQPGPSRVPLKETVPIDVSGTSFRRMCAYRESSRNDSREPLEDDGPRQKTSRKKHRRHRTVSGIPGQVVNELQKGQQIFNVVKPSSTLRARSVSRDRWEKSETMAFDHYVPRGARKDFDEHYDSDKEEAKLTRSCSLRRSLRSLFKGKKSKSQDLWVSGPPRSPGPPTVDLGEGHLRRAKSLPRSLKSVLHDVYSPQPMSYERSASTEGRLDACYDNSTLDRKRILQPDRAPSKQSIPSPTESVPTPKRRSRMQKLKDKLRGRKRKSCEGVSPPANPPRPSLTRSQSQYAVQQHAVTSFTSSPLNRPKSVDTFLGSSSKKPSKIPSLSKNNKDKPGSSEDILGDQPKGHSTLTREGKHVVIDIPSQPWTKPFSNVKLRGNLSNGQAPDRQSSSGHWSGSSYSGGLSRGSHCTSSLIQNSYDLRSTARPTSFDGTDSAISVNNTTHSNGVGEEEEDAEDGTSTIVGDDALDTTFSASATDLSTQAKMPKKRSKKGSHTLNDSPSLTLNNVKKHNRQHVSCQSFQRPYLCDDESSVYSVDQEGFYTSMHKDCGVSKPGKYLSRSDDDVLSSVSAASSVSQFDTIKKSSFLSKIPGSLKRKSKPIPPAPPPRSSATLPRTTKPKLDEDCLTPQASPSLEYSRLAAAANKMAAKEEMRSKHRVSQESESWFKTLPAHPVSIFERAESDGDSICGRVKTKTSISASAIPLLVSVTPGNSDTDLADLHQRSSNKLNGVELVSEKAIDGSHNGSARDVSEGSADKDLINMYSTWPRKPIGPVKSDTKSKLMTGELVSFRTGPQMESPQENGKPKIDENDNLASTPLSSFKSGKQGSEAKKKSSSGDIQTNVEVGALNTIQLQEPNSDSFEALSKNRKVKPPSDLDLSQTPNPVSARLIITSPVSNKAKFVENPQKRLLCSPVSPDDLARYATYEQSDNWYNELPRSPKAIKRPEEIVSPIAPKINKPVLTSSATFDFTQEKLDSLLRSANMVSKPLYPTLSSMKHSLTFPVIGRDKDNTEVYGGSWYDGIKTPAADGNEASEGTASEPNPIRHLGAAPSKVSFTSFLRSQATCEEGSSLKTSKTVTCDVHRTSTGKPVMTKRSLSGSQDGTRVSSLADIDEDSPNVNFSTFHKPAEVQSVYLKSAKSHSYSNNRPKSKPIKLTKPDPPVCPSPLPVPFNETGSRSGSNETISTISRSSSSNTISSKNSSSKVPSLSLPSSNETLSSSSMLKVTKDTKTSSDEEDEEQGCLDCSLSSDSSAPSTSNVPEPMPLLTSYDHGSGLFKPPSDPTNISLKPNPAQSDFKSMTLPAKGKKIKVFDEQSLNEKKTRGQHISKSSSTPKFVWPTPNSSSVSSFKPTPKKFSVSNTLSPSTNSAKPETPPKPTTNFRSKLSSSSSSCSDNSDVLKVSSTVSRGVSSTKSTGPYSQQSNNPGIANSAKGNLSQPRESLSNKNSSQTKATSKTSLKNSKNTLNNLMVCKNISEAAVPQDSPKKLDSPPVLSHDSNGSSQTETKTSDKADTDKETSRLVSDEADSSDTPSSAILRNKKRSLAKSTTNLHESEVQHNGLLSCSNRRSLGNISSQLSGSSLGIGMSSLSLAKSTDSLASCGSLSAERNRAAKFAFLNGEDSFIRSESVTSLDQQFAKYSSLGSSRNNLSTSRSNLSVLSEFTDSEDKKSSVKDSKSSLTNGADHNFERKNTPVQGRYVSSLISQFQTSPNGDTNHVARKTPSPPSTNKNSGNTVVTPTGSIQISNEKRSSCGAKTNSTVDKTNSSKGSCESARSMLQNKRASLKSCKT